MRLPELSSEWIFWTLKFFTTFLYFCIFLQVTTQPDMLLQRIRILQGIIKALLLGFKFYNRLWPCFLCDIFSSAFYLALSIIKSPWCVHKIRVIKLRFKVIKNANILLFLPKSLSIIKKLLFIKIELRLAYSFILWTIYSHHWNLSKCMSILIYRWFSSLCYICF